MPHEGGIRLDGGGPGEKRLLDWIAAGATRPATRRRLTHFRIEPEDAVLPATGAQIPLRASARFDNQPAEDVTAWTDFTAADPAAVDVDASSARATILRRGRHVVIARFLDRVVPARVTVPLTDRPVDLAHEPRANFIDDEVNRALTTLADPPVPPAPTTRRFSAGPDST